MLHTKFQDHRLFDSGEEDFLRLLPYMGMTVILVMWPWPLKEFLFPRPIEAPHKFWFNWLIGFWGDDVWNGCLVAYLYHKLYMYTVFSYFPFGFKGRIWDLIDLFTSPMSLLITVYLSLFLVYTITFTNIYIHIKYTKPFYTELQETRAGVCKTLCLQHLLVPKYDRICSVVIQQKHLYFAQTFHV